MLVKSVENKHSKYSDVWNFVREIGQYLIL